LRFHAAGSNFRFYLPYPCLSAANSFSQGLPVAPPQSVGMNAAKLAGIDALVEADIKDKKLPGAVVLVGHKGKIVFRKAYGNRSLVPTVEPMTVDTIFDVCIADKGRRHHDLNNDPGRAGKAAA
jgi:CubicO group peptidase (beta-lactamase class C family)